MHPHAVQFRPTLTFGFTTITTVFLIFGAVGYAAFGDNHTRDSITQSLPEADISTKAVKLALCCALFFTFPVMMVPVYEIVERAMDSTPWFQHSVAPGQRCVAPCCSRQCRVLICKVSRLRSLKPRVEVST
jgi:hypothetical protein